MNPRNLLTLAEAAALLGVQPPVLRQQIKRGKFRAVKLGRDWWVDPSEVDRYRRENQGIEDDHTTPA